MLDHDVRAIAEHVPTAHLEQDAQAAPGPSLSLTPPLLNQRVSTNGGEEDRRISKYDDQEEGMLSSVAEETGPGGASGPQAADTLEVNKGLHQGAIRAL